MCHFNLQKEKGVGVKMGCVMEFGDMESGRWYQAPIGAVTKTNKKNQNCVIHGFGSY